MHLTCIKVIDFDLNEEVFRQSLGRLNDGQYVFIMKEVTKGVEKALMYRIKEGLDGDHWRCILCYKFYCAIALSMVIREEVSLRIRRELLEGNHGVCNYLIKYINKVKNRCINFREGCREEGQMLDNFESELETYDTIKNVGKEANGDRRLVIELVKEWVQDDIMRLFEENTSILSKRVRWVTQGTENYHNHGVLLGEEEYEIVD